MSTDIPQDPLEGKGEEMIPDKGLPFDDIDETPLEDIPPEERIPDFEEEVISFDDEQPLLIETVAFEDEISAEEASAFEFSDAEAEAFIGDVGEAFATEAIPWSLSDEEADALVGDVGEAFTPTDAFDDVPAEEIGLPEHPGEARLVEEFYPPPDEAALVEEFTRPPEGFPDEGSGTFREDVGADTEGVYTHKPTFSEASYQAPGPEPNSKKIGDTHAGIQHDRKPVDKSMIDLLVSDDDMKALWKRADQAQKGVNTYVLAIYIARPMLDQIQAARNELMAGKEYYEDAERHINEVEYRVQLSEKLENWSRTLIPWLFIYLVIWFIGLIAAIFLIKDGIFSTNADELTVLAGSMIWGGMGGIIGALLPLIKHFSTDRDFAKSHLWWYITSPLVGSVMGAIIFLFMNSGLLTIAGGGSIITYILAGLAGYQHNVFTDLVKQLLKKLEFKPKDEPVAAEPT
ncbi:MAG: hypothetical protein H8D34_32615, partial [Chloroflexi bacterium]|nr:hypothetical protein [Chloroflexota bacterium]